MSTTSFVENNVDDATNGSTEYFANRHYPANNAALCHRSLSTDNKYVLKRPPMQHQQHVEQNTSASPSPRKIKVKMASELKKSESLRKMSRRYAAVGSSSSSNETPPPPPQPPPSDAPLSKFKSKSYLINSKTGGSGPNDSISSSLNLKRLLFSSSSNSHHHTTIAPHHSTISGVKTKKLASNVNLLQSNFQTCFFNSAAAASSGGKKKRSSLFNLFSFKNNSTPTPSTTTQGSSPSPARHTSSTSPSPSPPTQQQTPYQSYEASIRDSIAMIEAASTDDSSDLYSNGYDERSVYHHRQHHRQSLAPDHTMFINQMMPAKEELTESIRRLERAHSELKRPSISTPTQDEFEDNRREDQINRSLPKKAPSIRSKGFSIPLNASYCLNSVPINCLHHQYIYHRPTITYYHPTSLEETISAGHETNSTSSSRHHSQHLFKDYEEIKAEEENLLLAQKKSFDLEEENSCLKEVNMRLRFAQVKNVYNSTDTNNFPVKINNNSNNNSSSNQYRYEPESSLNNHQNHTSTNNNEYSDDDENQIIYDNYAEEDSEREVEDENEGKHHHHHHHQYQYSRKKTTTTTTNNEVELEGDEEEAVAAATAASLSPTSSSLLTLSINSTTNNNNNSLTTATNNNEKLVYHYHQQQQQHHQHHQQHPQQLLRCNNQLNEQNMFGNQHQLLLLNESKLPSTTAVNKEDMEKLNINNNSECKQETNNSKKKRFQQFQTRSLINLNAQLKKSFQQQQTNSSGGEISSATASPTMDQLPIWQQQQQQQQHQMIKPIMVISKAPSIRINHSDDNCYESNSIRLIYTYLKEQLANNTSSLPHIDSQWVKIVNGSKLRDLLKPVLDDHGLNLDDYEVFSKTSNDEQHLLVDMDSNSDDLSASTELFLRCKTQQQTLSQPQQPQQQQQQQIAKKEDDSSSTSTSATSTSTTSALSSPSAQNKEENTTNKEQSQTQTQSQATTTTTTSTTTSTPQQAQRKTTTARVLVSANSSSHLLTPNQPSYKVRKSSLQMPPPVESLIQTSLSHYNALSTQQGVDALGIVNSPTSAAVAAAAAKQQSNSSISSSSVNWQSYFNTKISKDKLTSKQKRNSCIAVMSEFSTSPISPLAPQSQQIVVSNATTTTTTSTNLRDSIGSFQSYVQSTSASSMLASATATITKDPNSSGSNKDSISGVRGKKNFKQIAQLSSIFTSASNQSKNIEQTRLMEKLNSFMKELPKLPDELNVKALDMSILEIEPDWCKYVGESFAQSLPVRLAKQQMAIWELLSTECSHIKTIKVIIDVFLCCLINLKCSEQTSELFKDIDTKKIFCNIADVFNCNLTFWTKYLHPIVLNSATSNNSSSTSKNIIDPLLLVNAFADFKCLFAPYEEFILERNNSTDYFKQKLNENENFLKFINWAENHPLVGRLKIADFMMIPVQRLTKYQLLIENIYQHTDDESRREKIAQIKEIVNGLPNTINIKLNYIAQFNDISDSIERYEGISGPTDEVSELLNAFKSFDIKSPLPGCSSHTSIRELIFQGPLKLKEASKSACDVYCFLFTDMLLITQLKKASKKYRIIKPPVPTNRMLVKELTQTDKAFVVFSLNDYNVPDSVNMFISNFSRKWIEYLELSKKKYIMELEKSRTNEANSIILRSLKSYNFEAANQQPPQPPQPHDDYYPEMENEPPLSPTTPVSTPLIPTSPLESPLNIEPPRRDSSSATLTSTTTSTPNTSNVGSPILENVITSSLEAATTDPTSPPAVSQPAPRPYQKRMDRQRRNMTDPTQHHNGNPLPASVVNTANDAASIVKRNSLNDAANRRRGELEEENMKAANRGDSTSTILSTDSGVSCFDLESISIGVGAHRPVKGAVTTVQQSTIKLNVLSPSSSPSSSSSYSSSSPSTSPSNFVTSSSSSSDKPTSSSSSSSEANCGYDMVRLAHQEENDDEDYYNDDDLIIDSSASIDPNRNGSTESSNNNNNESKTINNNNAGSMNEDIYNNSNGVNNSAVSDLNRQLMFRKQNNIRVKQSNDQNLPKHLRNLKQQQQQQNTTTNSHQFDMNNNQTNDSFYDYNGVTPTSNNTNTNTNNSSQRKPMIKIKSTTLKNESVRIQANEISNNSTPANFDSTVNSAHSNASNPDDDSHQRMMLVNLIHATMDATEV